MKQITLLLLFCLLSCKQNIPRTIYSFNSIIDEEHFQKTKIIFEEGMFTGNIEIVSDCMKIVSDFNGTYLLKNNTILMTYTSSNSDVYINDDILPTKEMKENQISSSYGIISFTWDGNHLHTPLLKDNEKYEDVIEQSTLQLQMKSRMICMGAKVGTIFESINDKLDWLNNKLQIN